MQQEIITVAVIDFGTFRIKGALAEKYPDGHFEILNYADEYSDGCVHRGIVYNMEITAQKAQSIISRLEKLSGKKIARLYVNVGGQSLRTIKHIESLPFDTPHEITADDIEKLLARVANFSHEKYEMLSVDSPEYFVNSNYTTSPVGVQALKIDARCQLIVARPQMRSHIESVVCNKLNLDLAGLLIAPLALGKAFLNDDQKKLGCVLIDFGSGSTTVSVFRNGLLSGIRVIPIGAHNITKDIMAMHITESEAERIKCYEGSAIAEAGDKSMVEVNAADKLSTKQLSKFEVCRYIEARAQELIDNIDHVMKEMIRREDIGGGVIVTGGGSEMRGLVEKLIATIKMPVEFASALIPEDRHNAAYITNPKLHLLYAMVYHASQECTAQPVVSRPVEPVVSQEYTAQEDTEDRYPEEELLKEMPTRQERLFVDDEIPVEKVKKIPKNNPEVIERGKGKKSGKSSGFLQSIMKNLFPNDEDEDL